MLVVSGEVRKVSGDRGLFESIEVVGKSVDIVVFSGGAAVISGGRWLGVGFKYMKNMVNWYSKMGGPK